MSVFEKFTDSLIDLLQNIMEEKVDKKVVRNIFAEHVTKSFEKDFIDSDYITIDFDGVFEYLDKHIGVIKEYIYCSDMNRKDRILSDYLANACNAGNAKIDRDKEKVEKFVQDTIKIIEKYYMKKLTSEQRMTLHIVNDTILKSEKRIIEQVKNSSNPSRGMGKEPLSEETTFLTKSPAVFDGLIGRDRDIEKFICQIQQEHKVLLMGVGGIGKSEFAKRVYWTCLQEKYKYKYLAWMPFDRDIRNTFVTAIDKQFTGNTIEQVFDQVMDYLTKLNDYVLVIVDNVPANRKNIEQVEDIIIRSNKICIIMTSRISNLEGFCSYIVKPLNMQYCLQLFFKHAKHIKRNKENQRKVKEIIDKLMRHTLSIEIISKSAYKNMMSLDDLHMRIMEFGYVKDEKLAVEIYKDEENYQDYCFELLKYIFKDVTELDDNHKEVLFFLATLPYREYDYELIIQWITEEKIDVLNNLIQYGWVQQSNASGEYTISTHPLISEVSMDVLDVELVKFATYFRNIKKWNEKNENNFEFISQNAEVFTELFLRYENRLNSKIDISKVILDFGDTGTTMLHSLAYYEEAYKFCSKVLQAKEKVLGASSMEVISSLNDLAVISKDLGNYALAHKYLCAAEKRLESFPEEYQIQSKLFNSKAGIYRAEGEIQQCIVCLEKVLTIRRLYLKAEDKLVALACNNLACMYRDNNRLIDSVSLLEEAINILEKCLNPNHPDLGTVYYNYALIFMKKEMWNYVKAKKYLDKAYHIRISAFFIGHPHVLLTEKKLKELEELNERYILIRN